jgi:hypothetical protein
MTSNIIGYISIIVVECLQTELRIDRRNKAKGAIHKIKLHHKPSNKVLQELTNSRMQRFV